MVECLYTKVHNNNIISDSLGSSVITEANKVVSKNTENASLTWLLNVSSFHRSSAFKVVQVSQSYKKTETAIEGTHEFEPTPYCCCLNHNPNLWPWNPKTMSFLGYPKIISCTKFEHIEIFRFWVTLRTSKQKNKQTDSNILPTPTAWVGCRRGGNKNWTLSALNFASWPYSTEQTDDIITLSPASMLPYTLTSVV